MLLAAYRVVGSGNRGHKKIVFWGRCYSILSVYLAVCLGISQAVITQYVTLNTVIITGLVLGKALQKDNC